MAHSTFLQSFQCHPVKRKEQLCERCWRSLRLLRTTSKFIRSLGNTQAFVPYNLNDCYILFLRKTHPSRARRKIYHIMLHFVCWTETWSPKSTQKKCNRYTSIQSPEYHFLGMLPYGSRRKCLLTILDQYSHFRSAMLVYCFVCIHSSQLLLPTVCVIQHVSALALFSEFHSRRNNFRHRLMRRA